MSLLYLLVSWQSYPIAFRHQLIRGTLSTSQITKKKLPASSTRRSKVRNSCYRLQHTSYQKTGFILVVEDQRPHSEEDGHYSVSPCHCRRGIELVECAVVDGLLKDVRGGSGEARKHAPDDKQAFVAG